MNEAAVAASRAAPHEAAAAVAAGGAAGLYRLRLGAVRQQPRVDHWFGKPEGMPYRELFSQLGPLVDRVEGALWMRQMVLGPAREFCVHAPAPVPLTAAFSVLVIPLRQVWPQPANQDLEPTR